MATEYSRDVVSTAVTMPHTNPAILEGRRILSLLKAPLGRMPLTKSYRADPKWPDLINAVIQRKQEGTIIAVKGGSGDGKSSCINALLDETKLVPTSGTQACTAVITEVSYNYEDDNAYRAEIHFLSAQEWQEDVAYVLSDLKGAFHLARASNKSKPNLNDRRSDIGTAFWKMKAVYPWLNELEFDKDEQELDIDRFTRDKHVQDCLDTVLPLHSETARGMFEQIEGYVSSKPRAGNGSVQYWPLIRKVCLFTKAKVLETGAVLVDLPGTGDSNPARATIAERYTQKCAGLWVVAPIMRAATTDYAYRFLMSGAGRQLHRDGATNYMSFICTKTDDINEEEVIDEFDGDSDFQETIQDLEEARAKVQEEIEALWQETDCLDNDIKGLHARLCDLENEEKIYKQLRMRSEAGQSVHPPKSGHLGHGKRKKESSNDSTQATKKVRSAASRTSDSRLNVLEAVANSTDPMISVVQDLSKPALTGVEINTKLEELDAAIDELKVSLQNAQGKRHECDKLSKACDKEISRLGDRRWFACVQQRNRYSTKTIQESFAKSLRDLGGEGGRINWSVDGKHGKNDGPKEGISLPVYCISSRGYQNLAATRFSSQDETGVTHLRDHAIAFAKSRVEAEDEYLLGEMKRLLTDLIIWSTCTDAKTEDLDGERAYDQQDHENAITDFVKTVSDIALDVHKEFYNDTTTRVLANLTDAAKTAFDQAPSIPEIFNSTKASGGLPWNTYRAVVRRGGSFPRRTGNINFNARLIRPFVEHIDPNWVDNFVHSVGRRHEEAKQDCKKMVSRFEREFQQIMQIRKSSARKQRLFRSALCDFGEAVTALLDDSCGAISDGQKRLNRMPEEFLKEMMTDIYDACCQERGKGCQARMQGHIKGFIAAQDMKAFQQIALRMEEDVEQLFSETRKKLERRLFDLCATFRRSVGILADLVNSDFTDLPLDAQQTIQKLLKEAKRTFPIEAEAEERAKALALEDCDESCRYVGSEEDGDELDMFITRFRSKFRSSPNESPDRQTFKAENETDIDEYSD